MEDVRRGWPAGLAASLASRTDLRDALVAAYQHPGRGYHDLRHLTELLTRIDELGAGDNVAVVLAAWYHDAVYDIAGHNEERSAALARLELDGLLDPSTVEEVGRLVRLTETHHVAPGDEGGAVLCDADLAILAAGPERYEEYRVGVRSEYSDLSDEEFRIGRATVLRDLLARARLFHTETGRERWEAEARANLTREIADLETSSDRARHWDAAYRSTGDRSWDQDRPTPSLSALAALGVDPDQSVIDVGGGDSRLVAALIAHGHHDVSVLDLSSVAMARAQKALGTYSAQVTWLNEDLLEWAPDRQWDVWHDRAVFHFMVTPRQVSAYLSALRAATRPGSVVVVATFAEDGPTSCSGLQTLRYSASRLTSCFGADFEPAYTSREEHQTPFGTMQPFTWVGLRRLR